MIPYLVSSFSPAHPGGNAVGGIAHGQHHRKGRHRFASPCGQQKPVQKEHENHGRRHGKHGRHTPGKKLPDLPQGSQPEGKAEGAVPGEKVFHGDSHRHIVAEGGSQPHAEHPAMEHQHIQQIQRDVRHRHSQHRHDQQAAPAGHLEEGHQHQRPQGGRRAENEAQQVISRLLKELSLPAGAHRRRQRPAENRHRGNQDQGNSQHQHHRGGISPVRLRPGTAAQGFAASHLHPRSQHAPKGAHRQQDRIGQFIRGNRPDAQKPSRHDIVNQKAQGNRQRRQGLRGQHLADQLSYHLSIPLSTAQGDGYPSPCLFLSCRRFSAARPGILSLPCGQTPAGFSFRSGAAYSGRRSRPSASHSFWT